MHKKCMMMLIAGMLLIVAGCSNQSNMNTSEETTEESAVDNTTADSDDNEVDSEAVLAVDPGETDTETSVSFNSAGLTCILPKGFKQYEDEVGLYVYKNYPTDISTISYVISESDIDISQMTQEEYKTKLEAGYMEDYGDVVVINITEYYKITVDGRNGLKIMLNYEFKGIEYEQLIYMLYNGVESHILNYTQEKGGKWMEKFLESGASIAFTN